MLLVRLGRLRNDLTFVVRLRLFLLGPFLLQRRPRLFPGLAVFLSASFRVLHHLALPPNLLSGFLPEGQARQLSFHLFELCPHGLGREIYEWYHPGVVHPLGTDQAQGPQGHPPLMIRGGDQAAVRHLFHLVLPTDIDLYSQPFQGHVEQLQHDFLCFEGSKKGLHLLEVFGEFGIIENVALSIDVHIRLLCLQYTPARIPDPGQDSIVLILFRLHLFHDLLFRQFQRQALDVAIQVFRSMVQILLRKAADVTDDPVVDHPGQGKRAP